MLDHTLPREARHGGMRMLRWRGAGLPGSPLVLLHGLGDGADIWSPVLRAWPNGPLAAIAPDLPGHGGSDWLEPGAYNMAKLTDHVAKALEREAIRKPVLIGHSLGARIALELAARGRVAAERVILIDVNPDPAEAVGDAVAKHLDMLIAGEPSMERLLAALQKRLPLADPETLAEVMPALAAAANRTGAGGARLEHDPEIKRLLNAPLESDGWAHLAAINCPVAILRGEYSSALDAATAQKMAQATRRPAMSLTIPKAGHAIALEQPNALAAALAKAVNGKVGR